MSTLNTAIAEQLKAAELRRLTTNVDRIIELNQKVSGSTVPGFLFEGLSYRHSEAPMGKLVYPPIHESLHEEMRNHLHSAAEMKNDMQQIAQALWPIIRMSVCEQDLRDGLPEPIVQGLRSGLERLERTREPGFMLEPGSKHRKHFDELLPKMEFYIAVRLIY